MGMDVNDVGHDGPRCGPGLRKATPW
jgi:hypothetical protein